jgi:hypothetical protein
MGGICLLKGISSSKGVLPLQLRLRLVRGSRLGRLSRSSARHLLHLRLRLRLRLSLKFHRFWLRPRFCRGRRLRGPLLHDRGRADRVAPSSARSLGSDPRRV